MPSYRFKQVDVFTNRPCYGNAVAVVLGAEGLSDADMQRIAGWTNLSETTFVLPPAAPGADYLLRIFTPREEMPFAGHPTIGSAHAVLEAGLASGPTLRQQCGVGIVELRVEGQGADMLLWARAPQARLVHDFSSSADAISEALGAAVSKEPPPVSIANGPAFLFAQLRDSATVGGLKPDMTALARLSRDFSVIGVAVFALTDDGSQDAARVHFRMFAPATGVPEDPVTGSANAALPLYLARFGLLDRTGREYVSRQGMELGREGRVHIRVLDDDGSCEFGGQAVTVIEGEIRL
ncbi:MAG: PhzF family phenazine biosynthesis protein [Dehalococcoidia bacterium]|nr:PhzF family phenazine biosynthesis protein [Dehalococcoidia bacterium]